MRGRVRQTRGNRHPAQGVRPVDLVPTVHSSADIRPRDPELTILVQGEIAERIFENAAPIFAEGEKESQPRYKSDLDSTRLEGLRFVVQFKQEPANSKSSGLKR